MKHQPEAKLGHPLAVDHGLTTAGDELRLDDQGRPVVGPNALLWRDAGTGIYLAIMGEPTLLSSAPPAIAPEPGGNLRYRRCAGAEVTFWCAVCRGKPITTRRCIAACLELPADLGEDPNKKEYVTAWVANTVDEILRVLRGVPPTRAALRQFGEEIATLIKL